MRKYIVMFLVFSLVAISQVNYGLANQLNDEWTVDFEAKEIKDEKQLLDSALKGNVSKISDESSSSHATMKNKVTGQIKSIETFSTTQLLKRQTSGAKVKESFATTTFAISGYSGSGSDSTSQTDPSVGVKATNTIYWDNYYDSNNTPYKDITSTSGSWSILDSSMYIRDQKVRLESYGTTPDGTNQVIDQLTNISGLSFNVSAPSSWKPVVILAHVYRVLGSDMIFTVNDVTSSWEFRFDHRI